MQSLATLNNMEITEFLECINANKTLKGNCVGIPDAISV